MEERVVIISRIEERPFAESWYEMADDAHFWFKWRMAAALAHLNSLGLPVGEKLNALEVGCGTGVLRTQFEAETGWIVDGSDLDYAALEKARPARGRTLYYDVQEEATELKEAYDVLILYDVLEHVRDTRPFIKSLLAHLKPEGLLLVNVPSAPFLYSDYDRAAGHVRRYSKQSLREEFLNFNVRIEGMRYWGFSLLPVLLLRKMLLRLKGYESSDDILRRGFKPPNAFTNKLFGALMAAEMSALKAPPLGSSILMVGRKTN